ncbi:helix-turn-helix domain-containing protein [Streptomyces endophyticus]|uniref:Helix-turn-helix domain-containing protein n=1 Tax=Streptomyces endophyticus TaxID=714166 RepID=A0ABU6FJV4_9ACTN|nr:helix-turn-helix transcriptional regulator [Streptomyces endophyticus]MEB8343768.1 helix-turn-helix domain-containing protein [Streptomyces endophyticus]
MSIQESRRPRPRPRPAPAPEPLLRHVVGGVLRRRRRAQGRTLQEVADVAGMSMPYLSEIERGRKEASSEMLAAVAGALGLGLVDVLVLAQGELAKAVRPVRLVSSTGVTTSGQGARGTVCLAA